jgi:adenylyltransferase/sulfurtransferase
MYVASAGVGTRGIADFDRVSQENLHRQILFSPGDIRKLKAEAAAVALGRQNPAINIRALPIEITAKNVLKIIEAYDIVVDCTDNYDARYVLNDGCVLAGKPLVYGAAYQYEGQVAVWNAPNTDGSRGPNYRDIFPSADLGLAVDCSDGGVMPTLTGIIGAMQANETIKYLAGLPDLLAGKLLVFDARSARSQIISLPKKSKVVIKRLAASVPTITAPQLRKTIGEDIYTLIDVGRPAEHAEFNIGGRLIPLEQVSAGDLVLDLKKPIVLYCTTGRRSVTAARFMTEKYAEAEFLSLKGGTAAWRQTVRQI